MKLLNLHQPSLKEPGGRYERSGDCLNGGHRFGLIIISLTRRGDYLLFLLDFFFFEDDFDLLS